MHTVTHDPLSADPELIRRSAALNANGPACEKIAGGVAPVARYVDKRDCPNPPAPAWYLPAQHSIYIHVDSAGLTSAPLDPWGDCDSSSLSKPDAKVLGLLAHEMGHAAISEHLESTIRMAPRHADLITLLEELRVENHAVRRMPIARRWLRASFGIILANMPTEFVSKAHVVRAWALARGRTQAGIASPEETEPVDTAARTLLGDDVVDGLTDLLQEALTLHTQHLAGQKRLVAICDEWVELVGDPPTDGGGCVCKSKPKSDSDEGESSSSTTTEKVTATGDDDSDEADGGGGGESGDESGGSDEGGAGKGDDGDDDSAGGSASGDDDGDTWVEGGSAWGKPGQDTPEADEPGIDLLDDEAAELMGMLARDLADLMADEWNKAPEGTALANAAEWSAKVFGNRRKDDRLTTSEPTADDRREVTRIAQVLSSLALPSIHKTARSMEVPPGRLRTREALRGSAERAQGAMTTARPWHGTKRRHSTAKPLVIGVATDTSGSMRWAEEAVARIAYTYTNAGHRIGARTAAVTFGSKVHRIARPGEVMDHVIRKTASDGTEQFDFAMAALDGVLHLTDPIAAARLLVVVSDGQFVKGGESDRAYEWLRRMNKAGTYVVWVSDREMASGSAGLYTHWLRRACREMNNVSYVAVEATVKRPIGASSHKVFDAINESVLSLVGKLTAH
jgi:hypothetical protein